MTDTTQTDESDWQTMEDVSHTSPTAKLHGIWLRGATNSAESNE